MYTSRRRGQLGVGTGSRSCDNNAGTLGAQCFCYDAKFMAGSLQRRTVDDVVRTVMRLAGSYMNICLMMSTPAGSRVGNLVARSTPAHCRHSAQTFGSALHCSVALARQVCSHASESCVRAQTGLQTGLQNGLRNDVQVVLSN